jgi:hypothetical protein
MRPSFSLRSYTPSLTRPAASLMPWRNNMLQSHAKQLQIKYMTILRREIDLRPEDIGAVRMVVGMALSEMQDEHRQQLNDMDDITADLLKERDQLKAAAGTDAGEILRLQTMEDRLVSWLNAHEPVIDYDDVSAIVIDVLTKYRASGATLVPAARAIPVEHFTMNGNGNSNGHIQITDLGARYSGRRLNIDDEQLCELAIAKIQLLAIQLDRTPTQKDWNRNLGPDEPSLTAVKARLNKSWNDLIVAAGLTPNDSLAAMRAAKTTKNDSAETEARTDDAEATFRGE